MSAIFRRKWLLALAIGLMVVVVASVEIWSFLRDGPRMIELKEKLNRLEARRKLHIDPQAQRQLDEEIGKLRAEIEATSPFGVFSGFWAAIVLLLIVIIAFRASGENSSTPPFNQR
jgi:hypothetical protein